MKKISELDVYSVKIPNFAVELLIELCQKLFQ